MKNNRNGPYNRLVRFLKCSRGDPPKLKNNKEGPVKFKLIFSTIDSRSDLHGRGMPECKCNQGAALEIYINSLVRCVTNSLKSDGMKDEK